jgi:hypothetical protein
MKFTDFRDGADPMRRFAMSVRGYRLGLLGPAKDFGAGTCPVRVLLSGPTEPEDKVVGRAYRGLTAPDILTVTNLGDRDGAAQSTHSHRQVRMLPGSCAVTLRSQ